MIYVFAVGSIAVYGVVLGGWASNNKYSFLGGLRSSAQLISYELPLGLGILGVVLVAGSLRLDAIIAHQAADRRVERAARSRWASSSSAWPPSPRPRRLPFDLPEAEQELVGGYHTEYSGIKLMMYLVAEFLHMVTAAFLIVILFLGGWHFWGLTGSGDDGHLAGGPAADHRAAGQGDGRDPVLHARPLELAAVPLRPVDGPGLEGDAPLGLVNLVVVAVWIEYGDRAGRGRRACRLRRPWPLCGWAVLVVAWLVVTLADPDRRATTVRGAEPSRAGSSPTRRCRR